jgi:hypothetical protein
MCWYGPPELNPHRLFLFKFQFTLQLSDISRAIPVAQTAKSAVSQASQPANAATFRRPADSEIGDTAGLETCGTPIYPRPAMQL